MLISENNIEDHNLRFKSLAKKLETTLKYFSTDIYIMCNTNLQISRLHPEYLGIWKPFILQPTLTRIDKLKMMLNFIRVIAYYYVSIFIKFIDSEKTMINFDLFAKNLDYLFVSHLIKKDEDDYDFYFGDILSVLSATKKTVHRLLIPHEDISLNSCKSVSFKTTILSKKMTKVTLLKYVVLNTISVYNLFIYCTSKKFTIYETISIIIGQLSNMSIFCIAAQIRGALMALRPKKLVFTYEGNAIERLIFSLCSEFGVHSIGYQHAPIIKGQYAVYRTLGDGLDPDTILCSGPHYASQFIKKLPNKTSIKIIGSPKYFEFGQDFFINKQDKHILLTPDGNKGSILKFIDLGLELNDSKKFDKITIRSHPLYQKYLSNELKKCAQEIETKINISTNPLDYDLKKCSWVIYQNSSTCIQALLAGCQVIYYSYNPVNVDPLWELTSSNKTAHTLSEVLQITERYPRASLESAIKLHTKGELLFSKLNYDILLM